MVYPDSLYVLMIDKAADRQEIFKLHFNNINRSRFDKNENHIFCGNDDRPYVYLCLIFCLSILSIINLI